MLLSLLAKAGWFVFTIVASLALFFWPLIYGHIFDRYIGPRIGGTKQRRDNLMAVGMIVFIAILCLFLAYGIPTVVKQHILLLGGYDN